MPEDSVPTTASPSPGTATGSSTGSGTGTGTGTGAATGTGTGTGSTPTVDFRVWGPDHTDSTGDPLAAQCDWVLPPQFSCDGSNPEIRWEGLPAGTTHLVLIFDDPDAGDFPHWGIYDIPAAETGLAQGISGDQVVNMPPAGASELTNGFGWEGYLGSCPGSVHIYRWRLFALDQPAPNAPMGTPAQQFDTLGTWAAGNALDAAEFCHIYRP